MYFVVLVSTI